MEVDKSQKFDWDLNMFQNCKIAFELQVKSLFCLHSINLIHEAEDISNFKNAIVILLLIEYVKERENLFICFALLFKKKQNLKFLRKKIKSRNSESNFLGSLGI